MALTERNALRRAQEICAKISRLLAKFAPEQPSPKVPHIKDASDHLLRDIGLHPADIEQHQHQLPSQTTHHPRS